MRDKNPMRICIIDDNTLLADALSFSLRDQGHHVDVAPDGAAGVTAVAANPYDVVVIDWQMPGMRGDQAAARVREMRPKCAIVLMSGGSAREDIAAMHAMRGAADIFIEKPFTPGQLLAAMQNAVAAKATAS